MEAERNLELAKKLAEAVSECGGRVYFVGGCVRDKILGIPIKDIDCEVHGVSEECLENILDSLGTRIEIGKQFGVYNIKGYTLDIALPRTEIKKGEGHRDFDVTVSPVIGTKKAAERRDYTVNAMMEDVLTTEITDHFGGMTDLKNKLLRHVNDITFPEDALRVLRGAQFAARFEFEIAYETIELSKGITLEHLPKERVMAELEKALLKAQKPSLFFENLRKMNQLSVWFPELEALIGLEQHQLYHKEGDVWTHTMMVIDCAAKYRKYVKNPLYFMMACLCHDLGKPTSTAVVDGLIRAFNHDINGVSVAKTFVKRLTTENDLIKYVANMVKYHMRPNILAKENSSVKATNKLFDESCDPEGLIYLALSDGFGKISDPPYESTEDFLKERLKIYNDYMSRPYVTGKDLISGGLKPDEGFSELLSYAHKLRLSGVCKEASLKQTIAYYEEKNKIKKIKNKE